MGKLFGTDGIRGIANEDLTCDLALKLGKASAYVLGKEYENLTVIVGRDTRISGQMLSSSICAGLMSMGANIIDAGIIPTPAISYLVKEMNCNMGVMITASHNPSEHNGIKLFDSEGFKLLDETEDEIEDYLLGKGIPSSKKIGTYRYDENAKNKYIDYLISCVDLHKFKQNIVVDCANGSASITSPLLFERLNINANLINKDYNGYNINDNCGSTKLNNLIETVKSTNASLGVAYDGDADRCLLVDSKGNIINGDHVLAILAKYLKKYDNFDANTIVGTIMSNLGLKKFCEKENINFSETKVGDRYVLENMLANRYTLGGEQSGHIIFKDYLNTGAGELTSIKILEVLNHEHKTLDELKDTITVYPQVLKNVQISKEGKEHFAEDMEFMKIVNEITEELNGNGRVIIRPSGTEDLVRVMVEGMDIDKINEYADTLVNYLKNKYKVLSRVKR